MLVCLRVMRAHHHQTEVVMVITGKLVQNPYGDFRDQGLYLCDEEIETIFWKYRGVNIRVTIEIIEEVSDDKDSE